MERTNANQNLPLDDPIWYFLAEFSLIEFLTDHDRGNKLAAGVLFQTVRELGMPPDCVEHIEATLAGFAKETLEHFKQGRLEISGQIRVYCQKKIVMNGGWGYFLVERGATSPTDSAERLWNCIDLYLYKEGE